MKREVPKQPPDWAMRRAEDAVSEWEDRFDVAAAIEKAVADTRTQIASLFQCTCVIACSCHEEQARRRVLAYRYADPMLVVKRPLTRARRRGRVRS